jgi:beta-N-acetylhexosaminidase
LAITALGATACVGTTTAQVEVTTTTSLVEVSTTLPPDCAQMLPPEAQAAQMIWAVVETPDEATEVLADGTIGGIVLDGEQSSDVDEQIAEAVADAPMRVAVAVEEEGGGVQPLVNAVDAIPGPPQQAQGTPQEAAATMGDHASAVAELGVTVLLAPTADAGSGGGMAGRTYSSDPAEVTPFIDAVVPAVQESGLLPVVKHWPGIGSADQDPVGGTATVPSLAELQAADLLPFQAAIDAGAPAILVGNVEIPGLTEDGEPASISRAAITGQLREAQGFSGLVVVDDLSEQAVTDVTTQDQAAELAIAAGADVVIVAGSEAVADTSRRLTDAIVSGRLDRNRVEESVRRAVQAKGFTGECLDQVSAYNGILRSNATSTTLPGDSESDSGDGSSDSSGSSTTVEDTSSDSVPAGTNREDAVSTGPPTTRSAGSSSSGSSSSGSSNSGSSNSGSSSSGSSNSGSSGSGSSNSGSSGSGSSSSGSG